MPSERAHYVPTFPTIDDGPPVDRAALATPADATVLLALSRLHEKKGLDILLRALAELPGCVAWIAGDGPLEADLKALAAKLGVADRVRFLGWRSDRGALLRAADICVLPSRYEPFGTVMLEAWATGVPLVAAASQGPTALIADGGNGLLVPVDDAPALAAAIRRLHGRCRAQSPLDRTGPGGLPTGLHPRGGDGAHARPLPADHRRGQGGQGAGENVREGGMSEAGAGRRAAW